MFGVAWALTGTERSLATILGGLLGGQFMLHSLFMSAAARPGGDGGAVMHLTTAAVGPFARHEQPVALNE
jgi:hypothetical protein